MTTLPTTGARVRRTVSRSYRPLQKAVWRWVLHGIDKCARVLPRGSSPTRVLLVRLDNIGDFVLWLDAAQTIVEHYRQGGFVVSIVASAAWAEFAEQLGVFDEVIALEQERFRRDLRYRWRLLRRLRAVGFAMVIQPTRTRVPEMGDAVVRATGAPERFGMATATEPGASARSAGLAGYTRLIHLPDQAVGELQANAEFVRQLTGLPYQSRVADLRTLIDATCLQPLNGRLPSEPYVILFPGASEAGKRWPQEHFEQLVTQYRKQSGCPVLICGGPGDRSVAEAIVQASGEGVLSLAGATSLMQLTALIAGARMLVSNDTAAVHLAAAVGVPSVCIVGGGHYGRFLPYQVEMEDERPLPLVAVHMMACFGCQWMCRYHPKKGQAMPCVEAVAVHEVWTLAAPLMNPHVEEMAACV